MPHPKLSRLAPYFRGKTVLLTGGSSGIGYQLIQDLLEIGARVYTLAEESQRLEAALARLREKSPNIEGVVCDIGDPAAVARMAEQVLSRFGCPDILINNAGWSTYRTFEATPGPEMERIISVNLLGPLRVTLPFLPAMKARGSGHIVNISSVAGKIVITPHSLYGAAKHGTTGWSDALALELKRFGIHVMTVHPGRVSTHFHSHETFSQRPPRPETKLGHPIEKVSAEILGGIARKKTFIYTPPVWRFITWAYLAFPILSRPVFAYFIRQRIEGYYQYQQQRPQ